ncbi:glutathione S-transferase N-terminal domain-containing protein [Reinekea marina]|uniref:Glutathione S-transferase N-terminal domain-containing protein n=1 Tax=Reinekea marina TaxID=1310421 RepID=A0ABV7WWA0_9GAMM|nr:glutathione S-transferase N-terminal domain-containing protein [Reinekea marina]MBU2862508.1 glutathione S-transferase N-terminal domain-containing protein [Reinekea forsetii]MDN3647992.1 glutathione S-transferase N-terminal domain-containing protein [Reinekea marina]
MGVVAKRSSMTFYSDPACQYSHRVRIVLAEKGVTVDIKDHEPDSIPKEVTDINPYNSLPTLVDRDLVLYEHHVMMEYLDERFPHPPLLPVYPVARGESRQLISRIDRDWSASVDAIVAAKSKDSVTKARKELREGLLAISPVFADKPYFMSEEFTLVDCCVAPILWRLPSLGIELPEKAAKDILAYMERVFERESFQISLSEVEQEMRD